MNFIEMWQEADLIDYATGGMDNIPEWECQDYVGAFLMNIGADISEHLATTNKDVRRNTTADPEEGQE